MSERSENPRPSGRGVVTAYEAAVSVAPNDDARNHLKAMRLERNIPEDGPEFDFYATLAPLLKADKPRKVVAAVAKFTPEALTAIEGALARTPVKVEALSPEALEAIGAAVALAAVRSASRLDGLAPLVGRVRRLASLRWPVWLAGLALVVLVLAGVAFGSAVATRTSDRALARELSTPAGSVALQLARANPDLASRIASSQHEHVGPGQVVVTVRLWAPGVVQPPEQPTLLSTAGALVALVPSWWLAVGLMISLVAIAILGYVKRGPPMKRIA